MPASNRKRWASPAGSSYRIAADQATHAQGKAIEEVKDADAQAAEERHRAQAAEAAATRAGEECQALKMAVETAKQEAEASRNPPDAAEC